MSEQERGQLALPDVDEPEAPATDRSAKPEQPFGDLSEAARGVVHEPADPRLEKHLARIGLGDAEAAAAARAPAGAVEPGIAGQLAEIKASVDQANARLRTLLWTVVVLVAAVVLLAVLVISR
jgi:hypothetical protein